MAKGRHRKQQLTTLPTGARVQTGKGRTSGKNAHFKQPLPLSTIGLGDFDAKRHAQTQIPAQKDSWHAQSSWSRWVQQLYIWGCANLGLQPPRFHTSTATGRYDPLQRSVLVDLDAQEATDGSLAHDGARLLWQSGFFGKGTLSRSEPSWRAREVNKEHVQRQRRRGTQVFTAEELTALRRKERRAAKIARARLAVRAGQQLADGIVSLGGDLNAEEEKAIADEVQSELKGQKGDASVATKRSANIKDESAYGQHIPGLIYLKPSQDEGGNVGQSGEQQAAQILPANDDDDDDDDEDSDFVDVEQMELLQLSAHEAFFLAGMLAILHVVDEKDDIITLPHLYALLLSKALSPSQLTPSPLSTPTYSSLLAVRPLWARVDNPVLLQYVAYHHFRSLGWVVRDGVKFCVDWLLYKRGPAFSHAEFAVIVLPEYEDPLDSETSPFEPHPMAAPRSWVWFSSLNRVNTQVLKTLILCYVTIPPLRNLNSDVVATPEAFVASLQSGSLHRIREISIRRYTPQRMRA